MAELLPCNACRRPARRRALYYRPRGYSAAILAGRYGKACFYRVARKLAAAGFQPEHEDAKPIIIRGIV